MNEIYERYRIPIMVVENGLGARDEKAEDGQIHDSYRIDYLRRHIEAMYEATEDGVDLMGYTRGDALIWSLHQPAKWQKIWIYLRQ